VKYNISIGGFRRQCLFHLHFTYILQKKKKFLQATAKHFVDQTVLIFTAEKMYCFVFLIL